MEKTASHSKREREGIELSNSASQDFAKPSQESPPTTWTYSSNEGKTKFCGCCPIPTKVAKVLELCFVVTAIVFVILVMLVPIAIHTMSSVKAKSASNTSSTEGRTRNNTCVGYGAQSCPQDISWVTNVSTSHFCKVYSGSLCQTYLNDWQTCAIGVANEIFIDPSSSQETNEQILNNLYSLLQLLNTPESCVTAAMSFGCQYYFRLCHCQTRVQYIPDRETCLYVSTKVCRTAWAAAASYAQNLGITLPDCSLLPLSSNSTDSSGSGGGDISPVTAPNVTCSEIFYNSNGTCRPTCGGFQSYSPHNADLVYYSQSAAAIFGLFVGIIVIIVSVIRWKIILIFPSVFLVYMTIGFCVVATFAIISITARVKLLCSSIDLFESINHPSVYCTITGAVFHYFLLNMTLWWFFHVMSVFYKVMFPAFSKVHQKKEKYIHLVLFVIGVIVPIPGVLLGLLVRDWSYTLTSFPQFLCTPKNSDLYYYSTMLPLNLFLMVGTCLLIIMFWMVRKHRGGIFRYKKAYTMSFAETKILFVLCYYLIFGVITLAYFGFSTADQAGFFVAIERYFTCEALGQQNGAGNTTTCDPIIYQQYNYPGLASTTFLLMALITTANLIFVINWNHTLNKLSSCYRKLFHKKKFNLPTEYSTNGDYYSRSRSH